MIRSHSSTWHPAYVSDYLPTLLEITGVQHPHPSWASDGMSLLPLIQRLGHAGAANDTSLRPSNRPLFFKLAAQAALIDNDWKLVQRAAMGHCNLQPGSDGPSAQLFHLGDDPTESHNLAKSEAYAEVFKNMTSRLHDYMLSVEASQTSESGCSGKARASPPRSRDPDGHVAASGWQDPPGTAADAGPGGGDGDHPSRGILPGCKSMFPPTHSPQPPPHPRPAPVGSVFAMRAPGGGCLTANQSAARAGVQIRTCNGGGSAAPAPLQQWRLDGNGKIFLAGAGALCLKPTVGNECLEGEGVWLGEDCDDLHGFVLRNGTGGTVPLLLGCRPGLCLARNSSAGGPVHVAVCSDSNAKGWVTTKLG